MLYIAAGLLSQLLVVTRAASGSILDSSPLKNNLLMCQRRIQFQCVSGHYGFITCEIFQAAGLLISIQCVCAYVCVSRGYGLDCIMETVHLVLLLCFFSLFQRSHGVCVETDENVTECWLTGEKGNVQCSLRNESRLKTKQVYVFSSRIRHNAIVVYSLLSHSAAHYECRNNTNTYIYLHFNNVASQKNFPAKNLL